jgi:serine/threonine protein kinase
MQKIVITLGLLVGMQYLHSEHCIHGSLNPENILIDEDFHPIVISDGVEGIAISVYRPRFTEIHFRLSAQKSFLVRRKLNLLMFLVIE